MSDANKEMRPAHVTEEVLKLAEEFEECRPILQALGDANRQHVLMVMIKMDDAPKGARVGAIAERTALSRPAVSHHIRILREAGIISVRREGTRNYYHFNRDMKAIDKIIHLMEHSKQAMQLYPDCGCEGDAEQGHPDKADA